MTTHSDVPHLHSDHALAGIARQDGSGAQNFLDETQKENVLRRLTILRIGAKGVQYMEEAHGCSGEGCGHQNHRRDIHAVRHKVKIPEILDAMGLEGHPYDPPSDEERTLIKGAASVSPDSLTLGDAW